MSDSSEEIIIINDLLSFMAYKIDALPRKELLNCMKEFYSKREVNEALDTFLSSLPPKKLQLYQKRWQSNDPLTMLFNFLTNLQKKQLPVFVCKDLNNIPRTEYSNENDNLLSEKEKQDDLIREQQLIKSQLSEISSAVYQLQYQIEILSRDKSQSSEVEDVHKLKGFAYLQKLIDDEEDSKLNKKVNQLDFSECSEDDLFADADDEQLLDLKANRMQRALVKHRPTSIRRNIAVLPCRDDVNLNRKVIHIKSEPDENYLYDGSVNGILQSDDSESDGIPASEVIEMDADVSSCLQDVPGILSDEALEEAYPFISVERSYDETVGQFSVYKCTLCNYSTNDSSAVAQHDCPQIYSEGISDERDGNCPKRFFKYFCFSCRFKCNGKKLFERHTQIHPQSYPCPFCDEKSLDNDSWTGHVMICIHSGFGDKDPADHVCQVCNIVYANPAALLVHKGCHDPTKPLECPKCKYRFYTQDALNRHYKCHVIPGFRCPFCHFVNRNKNTTVTHIRCHTGELPYACKHCDYRSSSQSALTSHSYCHTTDKRFKCEECPAIFKTLHRLHSHKASHVKDKIHKCPVCSKKFKTGWLMTYHHQRVHLNLRPHACKMCNYKARNLSSLKSHMNTHSNEKRYKCTKCDFKANHKSYLKRHVNAMHSKIKLSVDDLCNVKVESELIVESS